MSDDMAIIVENISKVYKLYNSPVDRLKESLHPLRRKYHLDFYALKDVSFAIQKGESVGIIGKNGSGKSTLLKIITGILTPTSGAVQVNGKVSALLELGAGFNPELTGIENVYFNGMLMGYTREEMDERLDDILSFADIGEFVYQPVKTYSSGMFVRLAFAVAVNVEPEIMIVDEALSVGDAIFQQKCIRRIDLFKSNGGNVIFVSHDMNSVKTLCSSALYLDSGVVSAYGKSSEVVDLYLGMILSELNRGEIEIKSFVNDSGDSRIRIGTEEVTLVSTKLFNEHGEEIFAAVSEEIIIVEFKILSHKYLDDPHYGIHIRNKYGISAFETNSYCMKEKTTPLAENQFIAVRYKMRLNISPGDYTISFGCANRAYGLGSFEEIIVIEHDTIPLKVIKNGNSIEYDGCTNLRPSIEVSIENGDNNTFVSGASQNA